MTKRAPLYELKDVDVIEMRDTCISAEDLKQMTLAKHLILESCNIETLAPILDSPLRHLQLHFCCIQTPEDGSSLRNLETLHCRANRTGKKRLAWTLTQSIPLKRLEIHTLMELPSTNPLVLSSVSDTLILGEPLTEEQAAQLQVHTLVLAHACRLPKTLPPSVKRLFIESHSIEYAADACYPNIQFLYMDAKSLRPECFPNLEILHVYCYENETNRPALDNHMPKLKRLVACGGFPFCHIHNRFMEIDYYPKKNTGALSWILMTRAFQKLLGVFTSDMALFFTDQDNGANVCSRMPSKRRVCQK